MRVDIECVQALPQRIDVIQDLPVRTHGRSVGDHIPRVHPLQVIARKAVQGSRGLALFVVHGSEPQAALRIHISVVEPVAGICRVHFRDQVEALAGRVEAVQAGAQPAQQSAARIAEHERGKLRRGETARFTGGLVECMDPVALDVHEPQQCRRRTTTSAPRPALPPRGHTHSTTLIDHPHALSD